jgi:RHS repeat-associated protein
MCPPILNIEKRIDINFPLFLFLNQNVWILDRVHASQQWAFCLVNRKLKNIPQPELLEYCVILRQIKSLDRGILNTAQNEITTVNHSESWNFDQTGNWSQYTKNGNVENRTYNAANELQSIVTHDANGNMILMPGLKGKYDAWNRLVEVRDTSDNLIATYEYNSLNQRIKKTVESTVTKLFFNENWQEVESQTNSQVTSYVWGLRYIDDLILREKGEERLYSLADPNWNVLAICDTTGDIQERYTYDAFGKQNIFDADFTIKTGTEFNWNRTFTGQVLDIETGLILYRNRYFHVKFGRFISKDPIEYHANDINLYRYVYNSPIIILDANGFGPSIGINIEASSYVYIGWGGGVGVNVNQTRSPCCDKNGNYNPVGMIETEVVFQGKVGIGLGGSVRIFGTYHELQWTGPQITVFAKASSSNSVCGE